LKNREGRGLAPLSKKSRY